jgi:hypothetical protein
MEAVKSAVTATKVKPASVRKKERTLLMGFTIPFTTMWGKSVSFARPSVLTFT